jgi:uracil-DNA glycosylase
MIKTLLPPKWKSMIEAETNLDYMKKLRAYLKEEYSSYKVYPEANNVFRAFSFKDFDEVKVVILGQDPYHTPGVANGLAFATNIDNPVPPSLRNIFLELKNDLGIDQETSFKKVDQTLEHWARQGVLLLNTTLTVREGLAASHFGKGWETFTNSMINQLSDKRENLVFILWGGNARAKKVLIDSSKHLIIESAHPSPLSAHNGFFESKPFSKTNEYLQSKKIPVISWD